MHTAEALRAEDFEITIDGARGSIETVLAGRTPRKVIAKLDRVVNLVV